MRNTIKILPCLFLMLAASCVINHSGPTSDSGPQQLITNRYPLVDSLVNVGPSQQYTRQFTVSGSGRVKGTFQSDTNIIVKIQGQGGEYYNSGKISSGEINVSLGAGTYYLIFSNSYSIISTKHVLASIYLEE